MVKPLGIKKSITANLTGCQGGLEYKAYLYVKDNGIESEADYPYKGYVREAHSVKKLMFCVTMHIG